MRLKIHRILKVQISESVCARVPRGSGVHGSGMLVGEMCSGCPQLSNATEIAKNGHLHSELELENQKLYYFAAIHGPQRPRDTRIGYIA